MEQARQEALEAELATRVGQVQTLDQGREALARAEQVLQGARWALAAGTRMSDLLEQLSLSGHALGLRFEHLNVLEQVQGPGYRQTPMEVQVVGRYPALRVWLDDWLGQLRLLRVEQMHWGGAEGSPGLVRLRLRANAYQADAQVPQPASLAQIPARAQVQVGDFDPFADWSGRAALKGPGEIPLAQLEMVGSLSRRGEHEALLAVAGRLYRVRRGERLGRDDGVVVRIDEQQVEVRERLFVAGEWHERTTFLVLRKGAGREAGGHEVAGDTDGGDADTDSMGAGGTL
ncbi:type IV pili biogenesis protein [Pseudomonas plecoglossicida]|uniref:Type IV pili biogenesis protein n=1 Tax=Pseudomonas plecoglossicida TaxID=70775 RepID=A0AAD0R2P6_PSEDL|nr:type IV pili biogenesis protein [Pseudomonas plecoglossicida]QLB57922.1 type 4a pilus biogenesis protein PilO [Pseudomonas plecoglossicida]